MTVFVLWHDSLCHAMAKCFEVVERFLNRSRSIGDAIADEYWSKATWPINDAYSNCR